MDFRSRLIATLRAIEPVLAEPGVLVIGSEVPNLLERGAASTLVISEDVDIGVPVASHGGVKQRLREVRGLHPSPEEPSVWLPDHAGLIEVNFVGMDPSIRDAGESYVLEDAELPLLVFGPLSLMRPGRAIEAEGMRIPVPHPTSLLLEKLVTDRSGRISLDQRVRQIRSRAAVRAWEYRQRKYAKGVWFRLRRVLADAATAYAIAEQDTIRLLDEGYRPEPVGSELEPPKRLFFIAAERVNTLTQKREIPLTLGLELLAERDLVLVRIPPDDSGHPSAG